MNPKLFHVTGAVLGEDQSTKNVLEWIVQTRMAYQPRSCHLDNAARIILDPYFSQATLSCVFVYYCPTVVPYYEDNVYPKAILTIDTILIHNDYVKFRPALKMALRRERERIGIIIHHLVHMLQCKVLGLEAYIDQYKQEKTRYGYANMPLENEARKWEHAFLTDTLSKKGKNIIEDAILI